MWVINCHAAWSSYNIFAATILCRSMKYSLCGRHFHSCIFGESVVQKQETRPAVFLVTCSQYIRHIDIVRDFAIQFNSIQFNKSLFRNGRLWECKVWRITDSHLVFFWFHYTWLHHYDITMSSLMLYRNAISTRHGVFPGNICQGLLLYHYTHLHPCDIRVPIFMLIIPLSSSLCLWCSYGCLDACNISLPISIFVI